MRINKNFINDLILYLIIFTIYGVNKFYLRPNFGNAFIIGHIAGSIPNLFGAFLFSFFSFEKLFNIKSINNKNIIYLRATLVFILLTSEEFFPFFTSSKTFDYFDILASAIGVIIAIKYHHFKLRKISTTDI